MTDIGDYAFAGTLVTNIFIPDTVNNLGGYAFYQCTNLTSARIGNRVTRIGSSTFQNCTRLTNVDVGQNVTSFDDGAFAYCFSLEHISIPERVTAIGYNAFIGSGLTNLAIPDNVTNITSWAFSFCPNLRNVTIGLGLTTIGSGVFYDCPNLTTVTISKNVTYIVQEAFYVCPSLTAVYFKGNAPTIDTLVFSENHGTIYYLPGTTGWGPTFGGTDDGFGHILFAMPTALWTPQFTSCSFDHQNSEFGFNILWTSGQTVIVESCTNLANGVWQPIQTNKLNADVTYFSDPQCTNNPVCSYRLRSN